MRAWCTVAETDDTRQAIAALEAEIAASGARADAVFALYGCRHDSDLLQRYLTDRFPDAALIGGSSHAGVMDAEGVRGPASVGLLLIDDPSGEYGAASAPLGENPADAAEAALFAALADAGCEGELPELIWIYQAPGREEQVIDGLRRIVGDRCPIVGGAAADDDLSGGWTQIGPDGRHVDGVVVAALFPSKGVRFSFQGGYEPIGQSGRATKIGSGLVTKGGGSSRVVCEIDGEPAARVYDRWTGNSISSLREGGVVLSETTLTPLAVSAGMVDGVTQYLLIHPESVTPDGAIVTFANVEEGAELFCMRGDPAMLVDRAGRVADQAARQLEDGPAAAALVVYCAGCRMAVKSDIEAAPKAIRAALGDTPFLGCFTYGEQGALLGQNAHGNLMISAIVFGS